MPSNASISINDYDSQTGIVGFQVAEVTAATIVGIATAMGTFRLAMMPLIRGVVVQSQLSIVSRFGASDVPATDDQAQRGNKWRVSYRDNTQFLDAPTNSVVNYGYLKQFDFEVPTANLTLRENNSDVIYTNSGGGVGAAASDINDFVAATNSLARSPYGGDAAVIRIEAVTRSGG